jgi:ABC-2 type transport system ATP-binding protein
MTAPATSPVASPPASIDGQAEPEGAIRVRGLEKRYGALEAVRGIDLDVGVGEIFGLIGPDGAGKTTTFQILGGVLPPTTGHARLLGLAPRDARDAVGYLTQAFSLYPDLSVAENLRYVGELRRLTAPVIEARGRHYLEMFDLGRFTGRLAGRLSGGMKQKLALACALIAEPRILLLDEPTTGVDPVSRREFWDALVELGSRGITILVATPYLDEAERCHRVALMHQGRIHQMGTPDELRRSPGLERLDVRAPDLRAAESALTGAPGLVDVQRFGDRLDVMVRDGHRGERDVRNALETRRVALRDVHRATPTLENAFVAILRQLEGVARVPEFPGQRPAATEDAGVAIGARGLRKHFGEFEAVRGVDLEVRSGEIYGLLGANGAGKTTTIKMLCGLLDPSDGEVRLAGETGALRSERVRQQIGYMSQKFSLYDDLSIADNLDFFAGVYGVPRERREARKQWVLAFAGLAGRGHELTGRLPGGFKQRVAFGAAIMHEPGILFLDEPTSGVDPLARRALWGLINRLADQGAAILVTTHYLEEAEQCNRLGLMVGGELVAEGTPTGIKRAQGGHVVELRTDRPRAALATLRRDQERWRVSLFGDRLHVIVDGLADGAGRTVAARVEADGIRVLDWVEQDLSLEDVFLAVVERSRGATRGPARP